MGTNQRGQIEMTEDEITAFIEQSRTATMATIGKTGMPHLVAMWYAVLDGDPVFWTFGKSQKIRNLQRDPRVTLLVEAGDEYAELIGVEMVGRATVLTDHDPIMEIGEAVYERYFGEVTDEVRPFVELTGAKRFGVRVEVDRVVSWDHKKLEGAY